MPSIISIFPFEIVEIILDLLAEDDKDHSALKQCSLVSQAFLPICRKHIFESIVLNIDHKLVSSHAFQRLLHETPEIADYIRKFDYHSDGSTDLRPSFQESLKRISRLKFLTVWHYDYTNIPRHNWSNNPVRPALLHLLHLPTLTHLKLSTKGFVVSDLIHCVNLKYLEIEYTTMAAGNTFPATLPEHSIQLNEFVARFKTGYAIRKLYSARRPDGQPIIDFGSLSKIKVDIELPIEGEASLELFRHCHSLTNVSVSCK